MKNGVIVLGIDPGLAHLGYGAITTDGVQSQLVEYGEVKTEASEPMAQRLRRIFDSVCELVERRRPDYVAIETLYFAKNTKTAIQVAQARGVALAAVAVEGAEVREITPLQIKQALTGYGRAEKRQIQLMVRTVLGLAEIPRPDHAADALAAAIACAHSLRRLR